MGDVKNTEKSNKPKADKPGSFQQSIISEQIKKRPINKYRLLRKTAITALLAILFGIVASITIWLLEPVLSKWVSENEYERILLTDADTYSNLSCEDLWKEADRGLVLYPLGHTYSHSDRDIIRRDFERLYPKEAETLPIKE